jgi:Protein of unknown function (DUF2585)
MAVKHGWICRSSTQSGIIRAMKKALPWLVLVGVLAAMAIENRAQGRLWICSCGYVRAWVQDINGAENSQQLFDPYTFTHVLHGFLMLGIVQLFWRRMDETWKFVLALSGEAVWEMIENTSFIIQRYRSETISLGYTGDTILNSFGDVLACALGVLLARRLGAVKTIALTLVTELALLITIRDSLLLNVIMLIHPSDAIRHWQSGH